MRHTHCAALRGHQPCGWLLTVGLILILVAAWLAPAAASAKFTEPDVPSDEYWADGFNSPGMNRSVYALTKGPDGSLYAGGSFNMAGLEAANRIARWDGTTWRALGDGLYWDIHALAVGADGAVYAGSEYYIARWDGTTWQPLGGVGGQHNASVDALAVGPDASLYVGGFFTTVGGVTANAIARWDGTAWHSLGSGMGAEYPSVNALAVGPDGLLYAGGSFTTAGGVAANRIARWDGTAWQPLGSGMDGVVSALAFGPDGSLYAGGDFIHAGGVLSFRIARWDQATSTWHPLGSGMDYGVTTLAFGSDGSLYAGGYFSTAGGVAANGIARWDVPTSSWHPLGSGMGAVHPCVYALIVGPDGLLYAGGEFTTAGGVAASHIARWNQATSSWRPLILGNGMSDLVSALSVGPNGSLYAGGEFTTAGTTAANYIARWDGVTWHPLSSGMGGVYTPSVSTLAFGPDGSLYAGGNFTTAGGVAANYIARWDGTMWHPLGSGMGGAGVTMVVALAFGPDGSLYAGGDFTTAGGVAAEYIARWDGTTWRPLGSGMSTVVGALAVGPDGSLYAGGEFITAGGVAANHVARWDGVRWHPLGSAINGTNSSVTALVVGLDGSLYAGGGFTTAGGIPANCIARWDGTTWHPLGSGMVCGVVTSLAFGPDGSLYAGGQFDTAGGVAAYHIARWDGVRWHPLGSGMGTASFVLVTALAILPDGSLYVGGDFTTAGGKPSSRIARWATPNVIAPIEQPRAGAFVTGTVVLSGFAIDLANTSGTGIDRVHIYLDGPYGTGTMIGGATYGLARPDVAAQYGARFGPSGWELAWNTSAIAPGVHTLTLYAHRTLDNRWSRMTPHLVVVRAGHITWLPLGYRNR